MIFVRNNSGSDFQDRYDGVDHVFPDGKLVECSIEAARHIFGYGVEDKTQNMIRLGWASNSGNLKDAFDRLDKFEFLQGRMMVQESVKIDEEPPVTNPESEEEETQPSSQAVVAAPSNLLSKMASLAA